MSRWWTHSLTALHIKVKSLFFLTFSENSTPTASTASQVCSRARALRNSPPITKHWLTPVQSNLAMLLACQLVFQCPSPSLCCRWFCSLGWQGQRDTVLRAAPSCTVSTGSWGSDIARSLLDLISYCFSCRLVAKLSANTDTTPASTAGTLLGVSPHRIYISQYCHRGLNVRSLVTAA